MAFFKPYDPRFSRELFGKVPVRHIRRMQDLSSSYLRSGPGHARGYFYVLGLGIFGYYVIPFAWNFIGALFR